MISEIFPEMAAVKIKRNCAPAVLIAVGHAILAAGAAAQESPGDELTSGFEPSLGIELINDDNIYRSSFNEQSSLITVVSPRLLARVAPSDSYFELEYLGNFGRFSESDVDDYDNHAARAGAYLALGRRSTFDLIASYEEGQRRRGTDLSEGFGPLLDTPDEYQLTQLGGTFSFGATGAKGRLVFEAGQSGLEYTNNLDRTQFFDRDDQYGGATFYLRVAPSTSLLLDLRATDIEYKINRPLQPRLDSTDYRYLLGVTWEVTGKTTGTIKLGYNQKKFDDNSLDSRSRPSWEVGIRWSPRSYSHFDFETARYLAETIATGDSIDSTNYSIAWSHELSDRVGTRLGVLYTDEVFEGSVQERQQERFEYNLTLAYQMRRWLAWQFGVAYSTRDSNLDQFDFHGTVVRLGAILTL